MDLLRAALVAALLVGLFGCARDARGVSATAESPTTESGFRIRLHRPAKVGDRYRIRHASRFERVTTVRREGALLAHHVERRAAALEAVVQVLAVTPEGKALERAVTIVRFEHEVDGIPGAPLPEDSQVRIIGATDGQGVIEWMDGGVVPEGPARALRSLLGTTVRRGTDDAVFGTPVPRELGDTWAIDTERARRELDTVAGVEIAEGGLRGATTLAEATQRDGIEVLRIETAIEAQLAAFPAPADAEIDGAVLQVHIVGHYPIDPALPELGGTRTTTLRARGTTTGEDGGAVVEILAATTHEHALRPLSSR